MMMNNPTSIESILPKHPEILVEKIIPNGEEMPKTVLYRDTDESRQLVDIYSETGFRDWRPQIGFPYNLKFDNDNQQPNFVRKEKNQRSYDPQLEVQYRARFRNAASLLHEFKIADRVGDLFDTDSEFENIVKKYGYNGLKVVKPLMCMMHHNRNKIYSVYPFVDGTSLTMNRDEVEANRMLFDLGLEFLRNKILPFDLKKRQIISSLDGFLHLTDMERYIDDKNGFYRKKYFEDQGLHNSSAILQKIFSLR
jgi:hypothetical protein